MSRFFKIFGRNADAQDLAEELDEKQLEAVERLPKARREMIERVIEFDEKRVVDVMAPRADIVAVDIDLSLANTIKAFAEAGHSRLPVYRSDLDDPIGMAHVKDVIDLIAHPEKQEAMAGPVLKGLRRDVLYVPPSMRITDLLLRMQASRIHMALVIDEFGGTDGLVTIEDLVEEVVGEINDEHDEDEAPSLVVRKNGDWNADARVELEEITKSLGVDFRTDDEEVDTLGGLVFSLAGRVPQRGEIIAHDSGFHFEVIEADPRKIRKIRIRHKDASVASSNEQNITDGDNSS